MPYLTTDQMIEVDRAMIEDYGIDLVRMMENAAALSPILLVNGSSTATHEAGTSWFSPAPAAMAAESLWRPGASTTTELR